MKFSPHGSLSSLFCGVSFIQKFQRPPRSAGVKQSGERGDKLFFIFKRQYLENGRRYFQSYY